MAFQALIARMVLNELWSWISQSSLGLSLLCRLGAPPRWSQYEAHLAWVNLSKSACHSPPPLIYLCFHKCSNMSPCHDKFIFRHPSPKFSLGVITFDFKFICVKYVFFNHKKNLTHLSCPFTSTLVMISHPFSATPFECYTPSSLGFPTTTCGENLMSKLFLLMTWAPCEDLVTKWPTNNAELGLTNSYPSHLSGT
jgi:hypothetical protein